MAIHADMLDSDYFHGDPSTHATTLGTWAPHSYDTRMLRDTKNLSMRNLLRPRLPNRQEPFDRAIAHRLPRGDQFTPGLVSKNSDAHPDEHLVGRV
jgi:hypothetical protein